MKAYVRVRSAPYDEEEEVGRGDTKKGLDDVVDRTGAHSGRRSSTEKEGRKD